MASLRCSSTSAHRGPAASTRTSTGIFAPLGRSRVGPRNALRLRLRRRVRASWWRGLGFIVIAAGQQQAGNSTAANPISAHASGGHAAAKRAARLTPVSGAWFCFRRAHVARAQEPPTDTPRGGLRTVEKAGPPPQCRMRPAAPQGAIPRGTQWGIRSLPRRLVSSTWIPSMKRESSRKGRPR